MKGKPLKKKRLFFTALLFLSIVFISGCTSVPQATVSVDNTSQAISNYYRYSLTEGNDYIEEYTIKLNDGCSVHCLFQGKGYQGGLSCDWANKTCQKVTR